LKFAADDMAALEPRQEVGGQPYARGQKKETIRAEKNRTTYPNEGRMGNEVFTIGTISMARP
jgi:hypothetical protein